MTSSARLAHLRRLTDPRGVLKSALGECPNRSAGYDTIDNIEALRLVAWEAARLMPMSYSRWLKSFSARFGVKAETVKSLAGVKFLRRSAAGAVKRGKAAGIRILASAQYRKPLLHRRNLGCLRGDDLFCQPPRERVFAMDK